MKNLMLLIAISFVFINSAYSNSCVELVRQEIEGRPQPEPAEDSAQEQDTNGKPVTEEEPEEVAAVEGEVEASEPTTPVDVDEFPGDIPTFTPGALTYSQQAGLTNRLSELYTQRNLLRTKYPYAIADMENQVADKVKKVRLSIESGEYSKAYPVTDDLFTVTEVAFVDIHQARQRIKALKFQGMVQSDSPLIKEQEEIIRNAMEAFLVNFKTYRAHRENLERLSRSSINSIKEAARVVLYTTGRHNMAERDSFNAMIKEVYGQRRPSILLMAAEFYSNKYTSGEPRPLEQEMKTKRIELDIARLKTHSQMDQARIYFWLTKRLSNTADSWQEGDNKLLKKIGKWIAGYTYDYKNRKAFKFHMPDIHAIQAKPIREKVKEFRDRWGAYGLEQKAGHEFVVTLARSTQYVDQWDLIWRLIVLEAMGRYELIEELHEIYENDDEVEIRRNAGKFFSEHDDKLQKFLDTLVNAKMNNISSASLDARLLKAALKDAELLGRLTFNENVMRLRKRFIKGWGLFGTVVIGGSYLANTAWIMARGESLPAEALTLIEFLGDSIVDSTPESPEE